MYIRISDHAYPISEQEIRNASPNVSFPTPFVAAGYAVVFPTPAPTVDWYHAAREIAPVLTPLGTWAQTWEVVDVPRTPEEEAERLAQAKAAKSAAVQTEKVRVCDGGFLVGGVLFDSDASANVAYLNYSTRVSMDPAYTVANWKASAGVWVEMTAALFTQVSSAFGANSEAAFNWQAARDAEIAAATTVEQVQAISEHYSA